MAKITCNTMVHGYKKAVGIAIAMSTLLMEGALYPSFTQGTAATFITWFRANILESGWMVAVAVIALASGAVGMFLGEAKGMKIALGILIALATAFLGADQIISLVTAKL
jgi:hypothetical protein